MWLAHAFVFLESFLAGRVAKKRRELKTETFRSNVMILKGQQLGIGWQLGQQNN